MQRFSLFLLTVSFGLSCPTQLLAQEILAPEIVCKLDPACPKPKLRGLRGLTVTGDVIADPPNSATFHINFEYGSAALTSDAMITLDQVGVALTGTRLEKYSFKIAGHTDSKGSLEYNQALSERRADSVKQYLVGKYHLKSEKLSVIGYGKTHLIDPLKPEDAINRRVQIINEYN